MRLVTVRQDAPEWVISQVAALLTGLTKRGGNTYYCGRRDRMLRCRTPRRLDRQVAGLATTGGRGLRPRPVDTGLGRRLLAGGEGFQDPTRNSTAITDRITMRTRPFAHGRRVPRAVALATGLRRGLFVGGLRG
jgi:hypothetical protein